VNIAIIPARGGSKRIPRKNIKEFCGKPMIAYSIEAALASKCFDRVIVSTDDNEIAKVAIEYGAEVPFLRPANISDDYATTLDVISHAINELNLPDHNTICCIYATAPFLTSKDLNQAFRVISDETLDYVFSATEFSFPIQRAIKLDDNGYVDMFFKEHLNTRSQDLEKSYHDAGQFYFGTCLAFRNSKPVFVSSKSKVHILPSYRVQDIDTGDDWIKAELLFKVQLNE
jgi:pseudaminic acid cytidylyltransferase